MRSLLDTCVLTELRQPDGHPGVKMAVAEIPDADLYLSVLTVGEIAKGTALPATRGISRQVERSSSTLGCAHDRRTVLTNPTSRMTAAACVCVRSPTS